jgi:hypothetical protein
MADAGEAACTMLYVHKAINQNKHKTNPNQTEAQTTKFRKLKMETAERCAHISVMKWKKKESRQ